MTCPYDDCGLEKPEHSGYEGEPMITRKFKPGDKVICNGHDEYKFRQCVSNQFGLSSGYDERKQAGKLLYMP